MVKFTFKVDVFWVVTPYGVLIGGACCLCRWMQYVTPCEDRGSMDLQNVGVLPQYFTVSQSRTPQLETSPP